MNEAASALRTIRHTDRETALFVHAARAGVTRLGGQAAETVFHLRRALATAEGCGDSYPWMRSYLSVCLDDALIVAGRGTEVDSVTTRLRSRESASGRYAGEILRALALTASEACQARPSRLSPPWAKPRSADHRLSPSAGRKPPECFRFRQPERRSGRTQVQFACGISIDTIKQEPSHVQDARRAGQQAKSSL